jgi:hypothetical protein
LKDIGKQQLWNPNAEFAFTIKSSPVTRLAHTAF